MDDKTVMTPSNPSGASAFRYREDFLLFGMLVRHGLIEPDSYERLVVAQRDYPSDVTLMQLLAVNSELSMNDQKNIQELLDLLGTKQLRDKLPARLPDVDTILAIQPDTVIDADQATEIESSLRPTMAIRAAHGTVTDLSLSDDLVSLTSRGSLSAAEVSRIEEARAKGGELIGKIIVGHVIIDRIGSGGQGDVYLAKQLSLNRYVAMKKLEIPANSSPKEFIETFRQEAQTLGSINHSRIVKVFEIFMDGANAFFTMEYIAGNTLKDFVKESGEGIPVDVGANLACQALSALGRTAEDGLIHRDIKPANMLIDENGDLKIVDFGLAAAQEALAMGGGGFAGTPHFASPEQCAGEPLTPASDQYSLGVTFYFALTGQLPFDGRKLTDLLQKHISEEPRPPSSINTQLPTSVDRVLLRMMAKQPKDRYKDFQECFDAWERVLTDSGKRAAASSQLLGESLMKLNRAEKDKMIKQSAILATLWIAMVSAMIFGENYFRSQNMDWVLDRLGIWGTWLLGFSLTCIFYVAAARRRILPTIGSLRVWLYTHIATAIPAVIMLLVHSGHFLKNITPGPPSAKPILSILMGLILVTTAISGSVGLLIFRELRRNIQLQQMKLRGSASERQLMASVLGAQLLSGWRLVHYPLAIFFILLSITHIFVAMRMSPTW